MLADQRQLILREVTNGTGASIALELVPGQQSGLKLWFGDLGRPRSPIVELKPVGLKGYEARLYFGSFAAETVAQMQAAKDEERQLARALVRSVRKSAILDIPGQSIDEWEIDGAGFTIVAKQTGIVNRFGEDALAATCRAMVIPLLGAMAELYGYDPVVAPDATDDLLEGQILVSVIRRRERNPRNRLLCLRIHGSACRICGLDPDTMYGDAGGIVEVHHIQPLALTNGPTAYDPETDLIPLCPNCHRAAHTRRPVPWSPEELHSKLIRNE